MTQPLPSTDAMYEALLGRDTAHDGRWFVGVRTTGVFCRSVCPARKPKRENCDFYASVADCLSAGYRPCKRCHPLGPAADADPVVKHLLAALAEDPTRRWCEQDITALGYDNASVRRRFRRHYGMTFLALARQQRIGSAFTTLATANSVVDAQLTAGFESASGFRSAFAKLLGIAPGKLHKRGDLLADWINTPLGAMIAIGDDHTLSLLEFIDRKALPTELRRLQQRAGATLAIGRPQAVQQIKLELSQFFAGISSTFSTPLTLHGSPFTTSVWRALRNIPAGTTMSYAELAKDIGRDSAVRAVARANGANQLAIVVPCHRVIGADGSLTGYGGGLWRKQKLLALEQRYRQTNTGVDA